MTEHVLKCWPNYFDALNRGEKTFEVRRDDRGFQKGDILVLRRTMPDDLHRVEYLQSKPKHELRFKISYVLTGGQFGIAPGYVVLALTPGTLRRTISRRHWSNRQAQRRGANF